MSAAHKREHKEYVANIARIKRLHRGDTSHIDALHLTRAQAAYVAEALEVAFVRIGELKNSLKLTELGRDLARIGLKEATRQPRASQGPVSTHVKDKTVTHAPESTGPALSSAPTTFLAAWHSDNEMGCEGSVEAWRLLCERGTIDYSLKNYGPASSVTLDEYCMAVVLRSIERFVDYSDEQWGSSSRHDICDPPCEYTLEGRINQRITAGLTLRELRKRGKNAFRPVTIWERVVVFLWSFSRTDAGNE